MAKRQLQQRDTTVGDAINTTFGVIEELAGEMREAYENTPESLQSASVGQAREEAADALENICEPDVPDAVRDLPVTFKQLPLLRRATRSDRLQDGLDYAQVAVEVLRDRAEDIREATPDEAEEIDNFVQEVEDMIAEAEGVEFPGMYG